ncbi:NB-ARC domain-containing protein [Leptothoe sp. ISB3NOV94-8A]
MARYALVVGISDYKSNYLKNLSKPIGDAEAIAQLLRDHGQCERVTVLSGHVTAEELEDALTKLIQQDAARNEAFIYFTGHGLAVKGGLGGTKGYLATSDCTVTIENNQPKRQTKAISFSDLNDLICDSDLSSLVMFIDACHSGELIESELVERSFAGLNSEQDYYLITSCRGHESAWAKKREDHSVFTGAVLDVLVPEKVNNKGYISGDTVFAHLDEALKNSRQEPRRFGKGRALPIVWFQGRQQNGEEIYGSVADTEKKSRRNWGIPLQMPPLPEHFVERPEHQDKVKEQLLCDDKKTFGTLVVSAIYGLGGIGKSVLASKLAHDDEVQARFADGILWSTLGQNPDILPLLSGWIQALGDHDYKPTAVEAASNHLRTLLYDKKALLVVDDVWNPAHLEPFRVGGNGCCVLVTTRQAKIPEAHKYSLNVMTPEQALELMTQKLKEELSAEDRQQALDFAARVGYLPLALELAASQIEEGVTWTELFEDFQDEVVRLEALDLYGREDIPDDAKRRKYSLTACFNLSLKQLSAEQLRQFAWLGIVPEDVSLTQEMAVMLWQVSKRQAGSILRTFSSKALLLLGAKQAGPEARRTFRMHDLMHDLAQRLLVSAPQPVQEGDLPGLGMTKAEAHSEFLERYRKKTERGQWHTLTDDGYIFDRLTWHMEQAKQVQEIHGLLQTSNADGRNGWYEACDAIGKPAGFVNDVGRAWEIAKKSYENEPGETLVLLFRYALMRTSINSMASNVPAELVGALVEKKVWSPAQGLAYSQQAQDPWHRATCISIIVPYIPESLLPEVQQAVGQLKEAAYRSYVLANLANKFPQLWADVLVAIKHIQDLYGDHRLNANGFPCQTCALQKIVEKLPKDYVVEALAIAQQIINHDDRGVALAIIVKRLPKVLPEALETIREIENKSSRVSALQKLTEYLPELWLEILETIRNINREELRATAFIKLTEHLPAELLPEALDIIRDIVKEDPRTRMLSALAKHLTTELSKEALGIIYDISKEDFRANALSALTKQLSTEFLPEALEITRNMASEQNRSNVLSELVQKLPTEFLPEALEITRNMASEQNRSNVLTKFVKRLPELLPETLKVTHRIKDKSSRASALWQLAQYLPELWPEALHLQCNALRHSCSTSELRDFANQLPFELLPQALSRIHEIDFELARLCFLGAISKRLPTYLIPKALESTRNINDESSYVSALQKIVCNSPELQPEVLAVARSIGDKYWRARLLSVLAKNSSELWLEALKIARSVDEKYLRARLLSVLTNNLPELWPEVFKIIPSVDDEYSRAGLLREITEHLPTELYPEVLEIVRSIDDEYSRAGILRKLAEHLPELLPEALEATRNIDNESLCAIELSELIQHLPTELLPEVLELARNINNESFFVIVLNELAKYSSEVLSEVFPEVLEVIFSVDTELFRGTALQELTTYLPSELFLKILEIVRNIKSEYSRSKALGGLAQRLPELWPEALATTRTIDSESSQSSVLQELIKYMPSELLSDVLQIVRNINHEESRAFAISYSAKYLSETLLAQALEMMWQIQDPYFRSQALQGLLPQLMKMSITFTDWAAMLEVLAYQNRKDLLEELPDIHPIILELGDEQAFSDILQAVREVCAQWP